MPVKLSEKTFCERPQFPIVIVLLFMFPLPYLRIFYSVDDLSKEGLRLMKIPWFQVIKSKIIYLFVWLIKSGIRVDRTQTWFNWSVFNLPIENTGVLRKYLITENSCLNFILGDFTLKSILFFIHILKNVFYEINH